MLEAEHTRGILINQALIVWLELFNIWESICFRVEIKLAGIENSSNKLKTECNLLYCAMTHLNSLIHSNISQSFSLQRYL